MNSLQPSLLPEGSGYNETPYGDSSKPAESKYNMLKDHELKSIYNERL